MLSRAKGCLLGQLCGDALGSLVGFSTAEDIWRRYPGGVRDMEDGGTWNTIASQPTDDSELALALARTLVAEGRFQVQSVRAAYVAWLRSDPFDVGPTTSSGLTGHPNRRSESNGAMMRISPIGIFGALQPPVQVAEWASEDAAITHPSEVCRQASAVYAVSIAYAIRHACPPEELHRSATRWAREARADSRLQQALEQAAEEPPSDSVSNQGWVLIALQNAFWQLLHAENPEEAIVDTVLRGGDTDTNAAICGALAGSVWGLEALPDRWVATITSCRPEAGRPKVRHPRPRCSWPCDALDLAERLLRAGATSQDPPSAPIGD
ncbi:MAG: ADP-ribosylglycohydrolase family protein [Armatimonadetes bacterium]|nr:ADP-ribosylglycohydrolase family protein [Armatimonadota bacterium]